MKSGDLIETLKIMTILYTDLCHKSTTKVPKRFSFGFDVSVVHLGLQSGVEGKKLQWAEPRRNEARECIATPEQHQRCYPKALFEDDKQF